MSSDRKRLTPTASESLEEVASSGPVAVSIIIPVFNRTHSLLRALDKVQRQQFRDFEVIVIDDGSADDSAAAARNCGIPGLKLIRHGRNRGPAAARNTGIAAASGRYIAFLDSDDAWEPGKLARQVPTLENAPEHVGGCATGYHLQKMDRHLSVCLQFPPGSYRSEVLFGCTISPGSTLLVRRDVFDKVGLFDESFRRLEDWDWLLRFVEHYDMTFISEPLASINVDYRDDRSMPDHADPFLLSIRSIEAKHAARIRARGNLAWRQFRSTILLEKAARMYHKKRMMTAIAHVVGSLCVYPFRNWSFFMTLWHSTFSLLNRQPALSPDEHLS